MDRIDRKSWLAGEGASCSFGVFGRVTGARKQTLVEGVAAIERMQHTAANGRDRPSVEEQRKNRGAA